MIKIENKIKLIIWDMDETFWDGTISEGPVVIPQDRYNILNTLTDRGIVNSICSKNDFSCVKNKLEMYGMWDFFIFPSISWGSKGVLVLDIVRKAKLRAENVLFIDDNIANLNEALYLMPDLQVSTPTVIKDLLTNQMLYGNDDKSHSRLKHYRVLESKIIDQVQSKVSNEEFLKHSRIRVDVDIFEDKHLDRIYDLVSRSNQLNYTKLRESLKELQKYISSDLYEAFVVGVKDKYGDYGVCGFAVVHRKGHLRHFVFSCRIIGMGIETMVYHHLNCPTLNIVYPVSNEIGGVKPNWININQYHGESIGSGDVAMNEALMECNEAKKAIKLLMVGGCDLSQMEVYLNDKFTLTTRFNEVRNSINVRSDHTELILTNLNWQKKIPLRKIKFLDHKSFGSSFFIERKYNAVIFSPLMDFHQGIYRHHKTGLVVPKDSFEIDLTDLEHLDNTVLEKYGVSFLKWFKKNFKFEGPISAEKFKDNLIKIREMIPLDVKLFILTGSEVILSNNKFEQKHQARHVEMNAALEELEELGIIHIIDVRSTVLSKNDHLENNIRHYTRDKYFELSCLIECKVLDVLKNYKKI